MGANLFITAARIHNGTNWLPEGAVIETDETGTILAVHEKNTPAIFYEGILVPGFVNVHCHLELSHMKDVVPEATGLIPFLQAIPTQRNNFTEEQKRIARIEAYQSMVAQGIVAVGDIANSDETLDVRLLQDLHMHTFVECIGFTEQFAQARLDYSLNVAAAFEAQQSDGCILRQSVIPHAPYSVSAPLFKLINEVMPGSLISIHNQESPAEDLFYKKKEGAVRDLLQGLGINDEFFRPSGKSSLQTYLPYFSEDHPVILVHNTCTTESDVQFALEHKNKIHWCLCPNANQYIERSLPDVMMLRRNTTHICIGTDSLASNHQLSILSELKTLKQHFPALEWEELFAWATRNGAAALQMDRLGAIEPGRKPGIVQVQELEGTPVITRII